MNRKVAREMAVRFLFQIEFQKNNVKEQVENFIDSVEIEDYDKDYFLEIINGVINGIPINKLGSSHMIRYKTANKPTP